MTKPLKNKHNTIYSNIHSHVINAITKRNIIYSNIHNHVITTSTKSNIYGIYSSYNTLFKIMTTYGIIPGTCSDDVAMNITIYDINLGT